MRSVGIVPARMGSSRFPGKPLEKICGIPMIGHCYHRTCLALGRDSTYVATCDQEIVDYMNSIGGNVILTGIHHDRASTRTAEAVEKLEESSGELVDVVVMVQGDEPLIFPETIASTIEYFEDDSVNIVNVMSRLNSLDQFLDKNNVKVVVNSNNDALYFSREPIPSPWRGIDDLPMYMQTGVIAFRRDALHNFNLLPETLLEKIESVDMNRVLESGGKIRMVMTDSLTMGIDTPEELRFAEKIMQTDPFCQLYRE